MKTLIKFLFAVPTIFVSHSLANLVPRNDGPTAAPCSVPFTPYLYAGCYTDTKSPRALAFSPVGQNRQSMTVEKCAAVCKGKTLKHDHRGMYIDKPQETTFDMQAWSTTANATAVILSKAHRQPTTHAPSNAPETRPKPVVGTT